MPESPIGEARVLARYLIFQMPGWFLVSLVLYALVRWWDLSVRVALLLLALWLIKDVALYPLLRRSYAGSHRDPGEHLVGALGTARDRLDPEGYVRVGAELWRAEVSREHAPVDSGAKVRVRSVRGLTLEVEPE